MKTDLSQKIILNSLNTGTEHDVWLYKLHHKKLMTQDFNLKSVI